jgi:Asp-tRNA(Asn)/Glu-tRNA(Gln) amidotransferase A subunit family amidase
MQIAGRPFEEGKILNLAYAYEQANEWRNRKPQI